MNNKLAYCVPTINYWPAKALDMIEAKMSGGCGGSGSGFMFNGIYFINSSQYVPYAHPDRSTYNISPYYDCVIYGNNLRFEQFSKQNSSSILEVPPAAAGALIGGLIGSIGDVPGAVIGGVVGAALGAFFASELGAIADEYECVWVSFDTKPVFKNIGSQLNPAWCYQFSYISVGPYSVKNFQYLLPNGS